MIDHFIKPGSDAAAHIKVLGISYVLQKRWGMPRTTIVEMIRAYYGVKQAPPPVIHLLGEDSQLSAMHNSYLRQVCRGIDTAKLANWGLNGMYARWGEIPPHKGRLPNYFERTSGTMVDDCVAHNIAYWSGVCASA